MNAPHPLVAAWRPDGTAPGAGWVVPSAAGGRLYRKCGWRGLQRELAGWALASGLDPLALRFASALPAADDGRAPREPVLRSVLREGDAWLCALHVPFELATFVGHFPTVPIVPGAQLAGWAARLAARHAGWVHGVRAAQQLKFRRIVQPGLDYTLALRVEADGARLTFRYERAAIMHAQGVLLAP